MNLKKKKIIMRQYLLVLILQTVQLEPRYTNVTFSAECSSQFSYCVTVLFSLHMSAQLLWILVQFSSPSQSAPFSLESDLDLLLLARCFCSLAISWLPKLYSILITGKVSPETWSLWSPVLAGDCSKVYPEITYFFFFNGHYFSISSCQYVLKILEVIYLKN